MTDGKSQDKAERLKAALKENLKKRKAQARGRRQASQAVSTEPERPDDGAEGDKPSD